MGNYITIPNKKNVKAKLETAYNKHLLINKAQFNNDFGDTNSFEDDFEKYSVSLLDKDDKAIAIEEFNTNFLPDAKRKYAEFLKEGFDKEEIVLWQRNSDEGYKLLDSIIISKENDPRLIEA